MTKFCIAFYEGYLSTRIKKKIKFSSFIWKFRVEQLQSHVWGRASSYMRKCVNISPYMRRPLVIYDFATAPLRISLYMNKWFLLQVYASSSPSGIARCWTSCQRWCCRRACCSVSRPAAPRRPRARTGSPRRASASCHREARTATRTYRTPPSPHKVRVHDKPSVFEYILNCAQK